MEFRTCLYVYIWCLCRLNDYVRFYYRFSIWLRRSSSLPFSSSCWAFSASSMLLRLAVNVFGSQVLLLVLCFSLSLATSASYFLSSSAS